MGHSQEFLDLVEAAAAGVREISVAETLERIENGATLIDVREDNGYASAHAAGAEHIGRGVIERDIVAKHPDKDEELILYCGGGYRSVLAVANLQKMGYTNVWSMAGGWTAWNEAKAQRPRLSQGECLTLRISTLLMRGVAQRRAISN